MSEPVKVYLCCDVDEMIEDLGEQNFTRGLTKWVRLADYEGLTARLAEAERERDENYRLWKEACRVKDIRHKAAKERRNSICLVRECLKVSDKWVCPECLTARLADAEAERDGLQRKLDIVYAQRDAASRSAKGGRDETA